VVINPSAALNRNNLVSGYDLVVVVTGEDSGIPLFPLSLPSQSGQCLSPVAAYLNPRKLLEQLAARLYPTTIDITNSFSISPAAAKKGVETDFIEILINYADA
jgi:hypothetical protein